MVSRRRAVAVVIAGAAFLGILAVVTLTGRDSTKIQRATPTSPATGFTRTTHIMTDDETLVRKLAERYTAAVNTHDDATIARLNCARTAPGLLQIAAEGKPVTLTGELERAPVKDRFYAGLKIGGEPGPRMVVIKQDGAWCVKD